MPGESGKKKVNIKSLKNVKGKEITSSKQIAQVLAEYYSYTVPQTHQSKILIFLLITIPKPEKDLSSRSSFHPMALLNQDYKLFTGVLAKRLNKIIS